ncbi:glycosyl transferase group 1 [Chloroherpeton thalassium ATCC 35110]|uniref:Glycosyl transferase group 1 n=1 Tax=Chloroherpeton thalassium (strain ATCC 35110 / GB-78) TaxID=517418 RepID=B3QYP0_CHLT3|nr:glycosyltransferase [Chloroherpeton thalassium]ACF15113.1 glycosyl transferase group 1 [Chloroherpeton thalassium ATCC 35110]
MKVLRIWHAAVVAEYRKKIKALAELPDVELCLLVPHVWREAGSEQRFRYDPEIDAGYRTEIGQVLNRNNIRRFVFTGKLFSLLKNFRPDIIDIEEEPSAFVTAQAIFYRDLLGLKSPLIFHTAHNIAAPHKPIFEKVQRFVFRHTAAAIARNSNAEELLREKGFQRPIIRSGNGIDLEYFYPSAVDVSLKERFHLQGKSVIGYVGKLKGAKGLATLLQAFARLDDSHALLLLGTGGLQQNLVELAAELGVQARVHFVGSVPHDALPTYYRLMDVLVLPSETTAKWRESFGRVLIEAMASGVPVIGSSSGAIPETIGEAGLIFPEKNAEALAETLTRCFSSPQLRETLARLGLKRATDFSWASLAKISHEAYEKVLLK